MEYNSNGKVINLSHLTTLMNNMNENIFIYFERKGYKNSATGDIYREPCPTSDIFQISVNIGCN